MAKKYRPRHLVLKDFVKILGKHDPFVLLKADNPHGISEYDHEAISILARFHESAIQAAESQAWAETLATKLVQEAFEFWFSKPIHDSELARQLAVDLLRAYDVSMPGYTPRAP